jgi:preprotein translocase subunit SecG
MTTESIHFRPVPREPDEGWMTHIVRAAKINLTVDSPLNPKAFHYGSLPYYLIAGTSGLFEDWRLPIPDDGSGTALKRLPGQLLVFWAILMFVLAIVHRWRYRSAPLPRWFLIWLAAGVVAWMGSIAFFHQTAMLKKVYDPTGPSWLRFLPCWIGLLFSFLPAVTLIVQTWFLTKIDPQASLSRLRNCFLLIFAALAAWLFAKGLPGILETRWNYPVLGYIGRGISVLAGVGTVALTYSYGSRCYNRLTGFLAALFLGLTVLHIQLCHYSAFDVHLAFLIMLALNLFERVQARGRLWAYALSGMAMGAAIAVKFSAITLPLLFVLPHLLFILSLSWRGAKLWRTVTAIVFSLLIVGLGIALRENHLLLALGLLASFWLADRIALHSSRQNAPYRMVNAWTGFALALLIGYCTLYILQPFGFIDSARFWSNVNEQSNMVTGKSIPPYTIQYLKTTPFVYCIEQLLARGFGFPLGIVVLAGWVYALLKQFRRATKPRCCFWPGPFPVSTSMADSRSNILDTWLPSPRRCA